MIFLWFSDDIVTIFWWYCNNIVTILWQYRDIAKLRRINCTSPNWLACNGQFYLCVVFEFVFVFVLLCLCVMCIRIAICSNWLQCLQWPSLSPAALCSAATKGQTIKQPAISHLNHSPASASYSFKTKNQHRTLKMNVDCKCTLEFREWNCSYF